MKRGLALLVVVLVVFAVSVLHCPGRAESPFLDRGVEQYRLENYEESIPLLEKARESEPGSGVAAFFLGMAYKQTLQYSKAEDCLRAAATLSPPIKEAVLELVDVSYQNGEIQEAEKWIAIAEREGIEPAKTAFLKGLVLEKTGRNDEAVEAFSIAKELDASFSQSADIQTALIFIKEKKSDEARDRLEAAVLWDPLSDLASLARHYMTLAEGGIEKEPLRLAVGVFGQYDSNVVLEPNDTKVASSVSNEQSTVLATRVRVDYVPRLEGPWLFNAQYTFAGDFHHRNSTTHDILTNDLYLAPGYDFGAFAGYWIGMYNHSLVRDPSYKPYLESYRTGPMLRTMSGDNHVFEAFPSYCKKNFYRSAYLEEEDRDSENWSASFGWLWLFRKNAFFNLGYEYSDEDAQGDNWDYRGNRFRANVSLPLSAGVRLQTGAEVFVQDFENEHSVFGKKREDDLYKAWIGASWEFLKNKYFIVDYTWTRVDSNLAVYDYDRYVVSTGVEFRY